MELRQLKYFQSAAEMLNFSAAAEACFITQSTLSVQIKSLESELGVPLFNRAGKHIEGLTEAGQVLLTHAKAILKETFFARQAIDDLNNLLLGELRIGVTYALSILTLDAIAAFGTMYKGIRLYIEYGTSRVLEEKLKNGELDLILTFHRAEEDPQLAKMLLLTSPLIVAAGPLHPLYSADKIDLKGLAQYEMILPGQGFSTRLFMDTLFNEIGVKPIVRMEMNDVYSILSLVSTGKWVTIVSELSLRDWPHLKPIPISVNENMERNAYLLWKKDVYQKKSATLFMQELRAHTSHR